METQHDLESWARATKFGRRIFNHEFRLHGSEMRDWRLADPMTTMQRESSRWGSPYVWRPRDQSGVGAVRVAIAECSHWREAQGHLHAMLLDRMDGQPPPAGSPYCDLGDVTFVLDQWEGGEPGEVIFARGNIVVAIKNVGFPRVDLIPFAEVIDGALGFGIPNLDRLVGTIEPWTIGARAAGADQRLDLELEGDSWLKVIAPGGELRESDGDLLYTGPATGPNDIQIIRIPPPKWKMGPIEARADGGCGIGAVVAGIALLALLFMLARAAGLFGAA